MQLSNILYTFVERLPLKQIKTIKIMATRSYVGIINPDNTIKYVYVHYDGNPTTRLPLLNEHFNTVEKINLLLNLGDISVLEPSIEKPDGHTFETPVNGYTIAYARDRGETGTQAQTAYYINDRVLGIPKGIPYTYLFNPNTGKWTWSYN